jgi:hypothetical protein
VLGRATISDAGTPGWAGLFRHPRPVVSLGTGTVTVTLLDGARRGQTAPADWREDGLLVVLQGLAAFAETSSVTDQVR